MKTTKIIYWVTTSFIFIMDGVIPAFTSNSELAKQGIAHLGYPDYLRVMLMFFKIAGGLGIILPFVKGRVKEWVYAGYGISFIGAFVSLAATDGFTGQTFVPIFALAILATSYICYHKLQSRKEEKQLEPAIS
jgi:hypothetical protein